MRVHNLKSASPGAAHAPSKGNLSFVGHHHDPPVRTSFEVSSLKYVGQFWRMDPGTEPQKTHIFRAQMQHPPAGCNPGMGNKSVSLSRLCDYDVTSRLRSLMEQFALTQLPAHVQV